MAQYRTPIRTAKYISQYDPLLNQQIEKDLELRDKNFKTTYAAMAEAQAKQGDIFFVDQKNKQKLATNFNNRKNDILEKYNWEYDKAAPELANLVVEERNNPLYNLNKLQQQKLAEQDKLKSQYGNDAIVHRSVPLTLTDKEGNPLSPEDFSYDIEKRDDYDKIIKNGAIGIINSGEQTGLIGSDKAQYLKSKYTQGLDNLSPRELEDFKESMGDILDKTTTLTRDPNFGNIQNDDGTYKRTYTGYNFINDNLHRLIPGSTKYNFVRNADYILKKDRNKADSFSNILFSTRQRGVIIPEKDDYLNEYVNTKKLLDRVQQNKGKLETLDAVNAVTKSLEGGVNPAKIRSAAMTLNLGGKDRKNANDEKEQLSLWIETAMIQSPDKIKHFVQKNKKTGNYEFKGGSAASGASELSSILTSMINNKNNYLPVVQSKYDKTYKTFRDTYGKMYDYLKTNGIPEEEIIPRIQQSKNLYQFDKVFDLNSEVVAPKIAKGVLSTPDDKVKLHLVDSKGNIDNKIDKKTKENLIDFNINSATVDPLGNAIILTYKDNHNNTKMYAIKSGENMLNTDADKALKKLHEFASAFGDMKNPQTLVKIDNNLGYTIEKDLNTLRPIVKQANLNKKGTVVGQSNEIDPNIIYYMLLTKILRSYGIENVPVKNKF